MGDETREEALAQFIEGLCKLNPPEKPSAVVRAARSRMVWVARQGALTYTLKLCSAAELPREEVEAGIALIFK